MNLLNGLFSSALGGCVGDARAMSEAEMAKQQAAIAHLMINSAPDPNVIWSMIRNYRPPVVVPQGWADWYAFADESP